MAHFRTTLILLIACLVVARAVEAPKVIDATFEPGFEEVLRANALLLTEGGAGVVEWQGGRYFVAVGVTSVRDPAVADRMRQIRVARINALRAAAEFIAPTEVKTETTLRETTTVRREDGTSKGSVQKTLDETTRTNVQAIVRAPEQVGSWKSADGKLFFYALGAKLPN